MFMMIISKVKFRAQLFRMMPKVVFLAPHFLGDCAKPKSRDPRPMVTYLSNLPHVAPKSSTVPDGHSSLQETT